ncbi:TonB-dependent receptor domain-containing protein [Parasediminibacterium paludis]|uniref:TonB-dependent receptor domain-containing protein n=1 Tax=Parasediminibacterium paludis TaxID=908966 RepID=A0ABV8PSJ6_9BACT
MNSRNFLNLILLFCTYFSSISFIQAQQLGSISGSVIDKQTQKPLGNASVVLLGSSNAAITDTTGVFRIKDIKVKTYNIQVLLVGYKPQTLFNVDINVGNENNITIELEPTVDNLKEIVVKANKKSVKAATLENPLSVQRLTTEEIKANPGGNFDISKVIQTLPGVGGGQGGGSFRNDIIIRGGAPNENVFYLDGIEIPVLNHFQTQGSSGGPQGMLNVSFIEDVKLSTSAFDAKYDNAMSSVFQFKQKNGNPNKLQGNVRLSATELATTFEGPLTNNKKTTFLFSARRSYLQLLFSALDLPIRPNYWDFQTKITSKLNDKTTLSFIGLSGIDEFKFATIKNATPEKLYILNSNPIINQWNYTGGITLKRLIKNGFATVALSRNSFDNNIKQYEDNDKQLATDLTLNYASRETENKLRVDITQNKNGWKFNYGASTQLVEYTNNTYSVIRKQLNDSAGNIVQPATIINFKSPLNNFWKFGAFAQVSKRFLNNRLGISAGIRSDMNTITSDGNNPLNTISPRVAFSYTLTNKWALNASIGRYFKIPTYTVLGFADNNNMLVNQSAKYLHSDHYIAGLEYVPNDALRFTMEGFYKQYAHVPVSLRNGIALSNLGNDFTVLGNEAVITNGKGKAYGLEFFLQKKLTKRFFGILSYTFYRSEYSGLNNEYVASSWDNKHLLSVTWGYKFPKNWELGLKFRYQGSAPYTPFDETASRLNYQSLGRGVLDYNKLNTQRLNGFNSSDVRIDKKWNFKKLTLDLYLDVTNWYVAKSVASPSYTFKRNATNTAFLTTDGLAIKADGSNAIPTLLKNDDPSVTPTLGFIIEF